MENLITLLFDIGLVTIYSIVGLILAGIIQTIFYKVFNFNIYKTLERIFIERR